MTTPSKNVDEQPPPAPAGSAPQTRRAWVVAAVVLAALGFVIFRGLGDATLYFKTADEAVRDRDSLGNRRFRIEGTVVQGSIDPKGSDVAFRIEHNGANVTVLHHGDPPQLFREGIPVVLEGRFEGERFASDRIMVKHTEQYRAENPERVRSYPGRGGVPPTSR